MTERLLLSRKGKSFWLRMYSFDTCVPLLHVCTINFVFQWPTKWPRRCRFKANISPPPRYWSPPNHPDNMDGFYDQQVPFMVPPSVSGHTSASIITTLNSWLCVMDGPPCGHHGSLYIYSILRYHLHCPLGGKWHLLLMLWRFLHLFSLPTAQVSCGGIISQQASERQEKEICRHRARPGHRR